MQNSSKRKIEILGRSVEVTLCTRTHSLIYKEGHSLSGEEEKSLCIPEKEWKAFEDLMDAGALNRIVLKEEIIKYCNVIREECGIELLKEEDIWQDLEIHTIVLMKEENPFCRYYSKIKISLLGEIVQTDREHGISITFVNGKIIGIGQNQDFSTIYPFRYHKKAALTGAFQKDQVVVCDCCDEETDLYYDGPFYCKEDIEYLCPSCIGTGAAIEKFGDIDFTGDADSVLEGPYAVERRRELKCTPGYKGWQDEVWLTHCNDYCEFVGYVGWDALEKEVVVHARGKDSKKVPIKDLIVESDLNLDWIDLEDLKEQLVDGGHMQGYLFKCLHCEKYRLHVDMD